MLNCKETIGEDTRAHAKEAEEICEATHTRIRRLEYLEVVAANGHDITEEMREVIRSMVEVEERCKRSVS